MKIIYINCPCCHNKITIDLDESFNVISIRHNCKKKFKHIEFGDLREGENNK